MRERGVKAGRCQMSEWYANSDPAAITIGSFFVMNDLLFAFANKRKEDEM